MTKHRLQSKCQACGLIQETDYHKPAPNIGANVCSNCLQITIATLEHMAVAVLQTQMPDKEEVETCFSVSAVHLTACLKIQQQNAERLNAVAFYQS